MKNLKVTAFDGSEVIFTDPTNVNTTVRQFRNIAKKKASDGSQLTNVRQQFVFNTECDVPGVAVVDPSEVISIKVIISGSTANEIAIGQYWADMKSNVDKAISAGALKGFVTQPTDTVNGFVLESHIV